MLRLVRTCMPAGVQRIALTLGGDGAALITRESTDCHRHHYQQQQQGVVALHIIHLPAPTADVVNLSGAGDTLVGGLAAALAAQRCGSCDNNDVTALAAGMAAARATVQSASNVARDLDAHTLMRVAKQYILPSVLEARLVLVGLPAELTTPVMHASEE
jgi:sugar/nucleoside kinase (ribokinase family)